MSCKPHPCTGHLAELVCQAARWAALEGACRAVSVAGERSADAADRMRATANQILSRAAVMEYEIPRFLAAARGRGRR